MCTTQFRFLPAASVPNQATWQHRRFLGSELKAAVGGVTPVDGDTFKIFKLNKHQIATRTLFTVTDADDTSIEVTMGYTDGTNASVNAFEASRNLNAAGVVYSMDAFKLMDDDGYFVTITIPSITNLDSDCEFVISLEVLDLSEVGIAEVLTAPV
jgi:hypothetical protein